MSDPVPLSALITALEAASIGDKDDISLQTPNAVLPTPVQVYHLGLILDDLEQKDVAAYQTLVESYRSLLGTLPSSYLKEVLLYELNSAFSSVIRSGGHEEMLTASQALCGLYSETLLMCQAGYSLELCSSIASAYDHFQRQKNHDRICMALLRLLSMLLLDGLLTKQHKTDDDEAILNQVMETVQTLIDDDNNTCLGDLQAMQERIDPSRTLQEVIITRFDESLQREYLLRMLQSSTRSNEPSVKAAPSSSSLKPVPTIPTNATTGTSEIQRRIQQVLDVLPDFGEGYVEAALSCYQGDVSRTVAALLEGEGNPMSLPPTLQVMDKNLPARHTETTPNSYSVIDEEARRITKERLVEMQRAQEAEAYAMSLVNRNEYDDDYDDQYDGMDGGDLGGVDGETYDVDFDTIRTYNRVARNAEKEDTFWEESRNLNRRKTVQPKAKSDAPDAIKSEEEAENDGKYRGPDKGKGGRIIGPDGRYLPISKGGKKGNQQPATQTSEAAKAPGEDSKLTKSQMKRKNDNKAKVANHHRKDRALKKTGM